MKTFAQLLKNPILKIFIAPLAYIVFGLFYNHEGSIDIKIVFMLYLITFFDHIIGHFFFQRIDLKRTDKTPSVILWTAEIILLILLFIFIINHHWTINILLIFALVSTQIIYFPYKFSLSFLHFTLLNFFRGFIWNIIAYYSISNHINSTFIQLLIPIVLMSIAISLLEFNAKRQMATQKYFKFPISNEILSMTTASIALVLGFLNSLPSQSFYILQILFILINSVIFIPLLFKTHTEHQFQNKLNYLGTLFFIFNVLYLLAVNF